MKKSGHIKLKKNRGAVTIKVEEVLMPIFARGLLNHREQRIVWAVIGDSWRWRNQQFTQRPLNLSEIARLTDLDKGDVNRAWRTLVRRGVIILASGVSDRKQRASFNEHHRFWGLVNHQRWRNTNAELVNHQPEVGKTPTSTDDTNNSDIELHDPKNNIKNTFKNNNTPAAASRRINYEYNAVNKAIREKFGIEEKANRIYLALKECQAADLHPLDLIERAEVDWFAYTRKACHSPDDYRDQIRSYIKFEEEVVPLDPKVKAFIEEVI